MYNNFNVRVYGICIKNACILINEELIKGKKIIKLPGGGLQYGEGTIDCLKREWREELDLDIEIKQHFYTTDFFQASAYDNSQIISIYYIVNANVPDKIINKLENERTFWLPFEQFTESTFTLPIDKHVASLIIKNMHSVI